MKLTILKPCRTPDGEHKPGDIIETTTEHGEYLTANGYARASGPIVETAEARMVNVETADFKTSKARRTK